MPRRKCVFNKNLEKMFPFLETTKSRSDLHCLRCGGRFSIASGGKSDIFTHLKAKKHIRASKIDEYAPQEREAEPSSENERIEMCRTCKRYANIQTAKNLFRKEQEVLLANVMELTSTFELRNEPHLPCYICQRCEERVKQAYEFRTTCLQSFVYFDSIEYKDWLQEHLTQILKTSIEENDLKQQQQQQQQQPQHIEEVMVDIKEEMTSSTDTTDESDMLAFTNESDSMTTTELSLEFTNESTNLTSTEHNNKPSEANETTENDMNYYKQKPILICEHCGNNFTSRQHFLTHIRRHTNNKPYKCEICPKQCYTSTELKRHMRRHTGERPFECKHCQRRFTDQSTLIKHERMHTNERPFPCSQCRKAFTTSYGLKNHMLVHTGERSFKCTFCNKAFQRMTHLTTHFRSIMHKQTIERQSNFQEISLTTLESTPSQYIKSENFNTI